MKKVEQEFIYENMEIHSTIKDLLKSANKSIKVATAWFTDEELFDILLEKANEGIKVEVVIADKEENFKIDFEKLKSKNASVIVMNNSTYGMMHQKYCIVDDVNAISGSYNWTISAKKNNKEGVIVTSDEKTVRQMIQNFESLIKNQKSVKNIIRKSIKKEEPRKEGQEMEILREPKTEERTLESLFNQIIESEVVDIDLNSIKQKGQEACKDTLGGIDAFVVYLDNLKLEFTNNLTLSDDKKAKILSSIEELTAREVNNTERSFDQRLEAIKEKFQEEKKELEKTLEDANEKVLNNNADQEKINLNKIESKKNQITSLKEKLIELKANLKTTSIAWYDLIPKIILGIGLGALVYLFYSSAMYIMLYTGSDFQEALFNGSIPETPTFFDSGAISKAIEKGGTAVLFVCLIPIFLYFFAFLKRFTKNWKKWQELALTGIVVLFIDGVIAFIVADTIHYSKFLNNEVQSQSITFKEAIVDLNFLSVLICGVTTLIALKAVVTSIWKDLDAQNKNHVANELKVQVEKINGQIEHCGEIVNQGQIELIELKKELEILKTNQNQAQIKLKEEKNQLDSKLGNLTTSKEKEVAHLTQLADLYTARVENENLLFNTNFLDQRINAFIEGWDEFLYDFYNQQVAEEKVKEIKIALNNWKNNQKTIKKVA